jgi:PAS domain S-box-containing protein
MFLIAGTDVMQRLDLVFENAPIGLLVCDSRNKFSQANKALFDMLGYKRQELAGADIADLIHLEDRPFRKRVFKEFFTGKRDSSQLEERYLHKDRHEVWCKVDVALVRDRRGDPQLFIHTLEDISDRKQAEASMQRLVRHYEQILNAAGWGICGVDRHSRIAFANSEAARMLAWSVDDLVAQPLRVISPIEGGLTDSPDLATSVAGALRDGLIRQSVSDELIRSDGSHLPVEYTVTPLVEDGIVSGVVILIIENTRRIENARRMQECVDKLVQINSTLLAAQKNERGRE